MASPVKDAKAKHIASGFTEISERGRGHLKSRKPSTDQYALTTQVGERGWHRGVGPYVEADEVDTAWVSSGPITYEMLLGDPYQAEINLAQASYRYEDMDSGESVELFAESVLQWVNDLGDSETAAGLSAPTTSVDDDTITFEGLFGVGSRLAIQAQTAALKKLLTLDNDTILSTPTLPGTVSLSFSLRFQRSAGVSIWIDGAEWDEKGNNPQETSSRVEFRNVSNDELFGFRVPYASDDNGAKQPGTMYLKKTGANLFVDVRIPYAWVSTATYPIQIDPTVDEQVGTGSDDAYQKSDDSCNITDPFERLSQADEPWAAMRWTTVAIEGTIDVAYAEYRSYSATTEIDFTIYGEDGDSPGTFTTADFNISGRTRTTASVDWDELTGVNDFMQTPSLVSVIQEIVDRGGWASGNDLVIVNKVDNSGIADFYMEFYEDGSSLAAKLHVEYTAGGGGRVPRYGFTNFQIPGIV